MPAKVLMYCTEACPYCQMALRLLARKGAAVDRIHVDAQPGRRAEMVERSGRTTVPQIFIGQTHVGGYTDLAKLETAGELDGLLAAD